MKYEEKIYNWCKDVDWSKEEDAIEMGQILAKEAIIQNLASKLLDDCLKENLTAKEYIKMSKDIAKKMMDKELDMMPDSEFKRFIVENRELVEGD